MKPTLFLLTFLLICLINPLSAGEGDYISLDLRNIDVTDALKFLATKAGLDIIPTNEVSGRITLMVENVPVRDVFDIMLRSNNLAYAKQGDIFNVMTEKEYKARYGRNFSDIRQVQVFRLKYAVPEQAYNLLDTLKSDIGKILLDTDSGTLLVMDTPEKINEMEAALSAMEEKKGIIRIFNLKYALAEEVEKHLKQQLDVKKVGSIKSDERTNQVIVQTLPDRMSDVEKLIQGLDQQTKQILIDTKIIQVKLSDELSTGVEWEGIFDLGREYGLSYLGSYPFSAVQDSTDDWRSREEVFADVGYVGSYPFTGTSTDYAAGKQTIGTEEMHLGVVSRQDFDLIIKYLKTLGDTRILSSPKLAVINNKEAKIHVGQLQKYVITTTTQGEATQTVSEDVNDLEVGTRLFITPTINDEGFVTIKIKPEITSVIDYLETSQGNQIPIVEIVTAETIAMVKDGTSLLIGGLSQEENTSTIKQTPFLGKLPLIGELFRYKTTKTTRNELLVLVTPHIIRGDELTTGYTRDFGHRLDKEYQDYRPFTEEVPEIGLKGYQGYQSLEKSEPLSGGLKPAKNL
ncbi:MAG: secretin N-terminal domain-containing protein [Candidatus Omnitrophota bacterium]|jgi:type II secretory pathway component GspD/PulD (secretin)